MRAIAVAALLWATPAAAITLSDSDVDAIGRVAYAEARTQPAVGLVAVIDTILNRVNAPGFPDTVQGVIEQRAAFEPVLRAGGWRNLPPMSQGQRASLETILALKADGALGDVSGGALFFQNPRIVAARATAGKVRAKLVHFGGMPQTAVIADHTFYKPGGTASRKPEKPQALGMAEGVTRDLRALGSEVR